MTDTSLDRAMDELEATALGIKAERDSLLAECRRLQAENERLREALDFVKCWLNPAGGQREDILQSIYEKARMTLLETKFGNPSNDVKARAALKRYE